MRNKSLKYILATLSFMFFFYGVNSFSAENEVSPGKKPPFDKVSPLTKYIGDSETVQRSDLPSNVQQKINEIARNAFENISELPEDATVESMYGPIYKISIPHDLYLFFFEINSYLTQGTMEAILFDPKTQKITQEPPTLHFDKPIKISFIDIDQDNVSEIIDIENTHCGTVCDWDTSHYYKIQPDLSFKNIFDLTTRSEGYCDEVVCETLQEIKNIGKNRIEVSVYVSIPDQDKILIGEIYFEKKNDKLSFEVVSYKVINQKYKSKMEWIAGKRDS